MTQIKFHKLTWTQIHKDCLILYKKHLSSIEIDKIVSISRGGNVMSRIFSDLLGNLPISHFTISSYHDLKKQKHPVITEQLNTDLEDKTVLIVDEVSDTGETFDIAIDHIRRFNPKKIYTLAPYIKPHTKFRPDFWEKNIDAWIVFPYDIRETAEGFMKLFGNKERAKEKMKEIGFEPWEIETVLS